MIKKLTFAFSLFCLFVAQSVFGQSLQYENQVIERIDIVVHTQGGTICDSHAILSRLSTRQNGVFSQLEFDNDLKVLSQDFDRVDPVVESINQKVYITLNIWPKPTIRCIHWHGNDRVSTRRLQRELAIGHLSIYERQAFNEAFHKLKAYYIRKGFFEAQVEYDVVAIPDTNEVDINIHIVEGRSGRIEDIAFVNFTDWEQREVLQEMMTKKYNMFTSWFTNEGTYNEEGMRQDELIIINYLQNQGYADAQVHIEVHESVKPNRIIVTITADKGEQYLFGSLSFEGNTIVCDEEIDRLFLARPGCPFSLETIRNTIERITDAYGRLGYIDAVVDFEQVLVEGAPYYDVHFTIQEGQQFRVGLIKVFGNLCTKTSVILHETLLVPGEIFNIIKLKKTELRLKNIGYFKNVNVYSVKGSDTCLSDENYRDVYIEVEETTTGDFGAFLGYSNVEELFGGIHITERNFNSEGFCYLWQDGLKALRGGGEYAHFTAQIGQKSRSYVLSWTKPHYMDTKWTVGFDINKSSTRYISNDYDLESFGFHLRAQYNVNQFVRAGVYYRLKNSHVDLKEDESDVTNALVREAHIRGIISAAGGFLDYNSTNHPVKPTEGLHSRLQLEYAGLGGDHTFLSLSYLNTYYFPVGSRSVIKYRGDFRFIQPTGHTRYQTIPLDERLFLGGEYTIRGFRPYRVGPLYHDSHIPRGGLSLQFYSVELTRRIMCNVEVFAFMDAGHLSRNTWEFGRMSVAVGYGTRFKVIPSIPEITLGVGYPLNARNRGEVKRFFISLGGNF